jgi:hypothetical protein
MAIITTGRYLYRSTRDRKRDARKKDDDFYV